MAYIGQKEDKSTHSRMRIYDYRYKLLRTIDTGNQEIKSIEHVNRLLLCLDVKGCIHSYDVSEKQSFVSKVQVID